MYLFMYDIGLCSRAEIGAKQQSVEKAKRARAQLLLSAPHRGMGFIIKNMSSAFVDNARRGAVRVAKNCMFHYV